MHHHQAPPECPKDRDNITQKSEVRYRNTWKEESTLETKKLKKPAGEMIMSSPMVKHPLKGTRSSRTVRPVSEDLQAQGALPGMKHYQWPKVPLPGVPCITTDSRDHLKVHPLWYDNSQWQKHHHPEFCASADTTRRCSPDNTSRFCGQSTFAWSVPGPFTVYAV